ncbi:RNA-directed DNA polymerase, eukaryota [Tanacetum coccineum]
MMSPHHRRSFMSNEDYTQKISHSIYVTNFPNSINSRDLWRECNIYGTVVDIFIPLKKSQAGKRFSFVCFIKVFNLDRLVKNLCTIWIGRHHLFANKVRFERSQKPVSPLFNGKPKNSDNGHSDSGHRMSNGPARSYTNVVNGAHSSANPGSLISTSPALVLDDNCIIAKDFTKHAMGRVKDVNSIPNLQIILHDEGFVDVKLKYLGGMWVMFEFEKEETKTNMLTHTGVNSWFHTIQDVIHDFASDERIAWVDIEGVPLNAWSSETFSRIGKKWGESLNMEDNSVPSFGRKRVCILTKHPVSILESFKIIVKGKVFMIRAKELFTWNPSFVVNKETSSSSDDESVQGEMHKVKQSYLSEEEEGEFKASDVEGVAETIFDDNSVSSKFYSGDSGKQNSEDPFELYDLLEKKKSGGVLHVPSPSLSHPPGFTPVVNPDIENDIVHNKGDANGPLVNESSPLIDARMSNSSRAVQIEGPNGSIGYSDGSNGLWNGELFLMGDFKEVSLSRDERAVDHVSLFPSISALCLDRHLSDHRPILLCEVQLDFGPIPFRFYHSWFSYDGFDELVEQTWRSFSHSDRNGMIRFRKKLQDLKITIRQWIKDKRMHLSSSKQAIHDELNLARRQELKRQLQDIKVKEDVDSIQKSKVKWAIEGDENSSFFHGIINKRRSQLAIRGIFVDGIWQNDPQAVKEAFLNHFEARFKKPTSSGLKINFLFPKRLAQDQANDLERSISCDEIRVVVWNCGDNKSPGPDGYTFDSKRRLRGN